MQVSYPAVFRLFKVVTELVLFTCALSFIVFSWQWPLVGDAPLIHYVVFLMQHGMIPYRDIFDLNMPGTLAIEATIMSISGGALAWRLFDFFLLGFATLSMLAICKPVGRFPALLAAVTFAMIHGRDGLIQLGQRDLIMTTLLLSAYALFFSVIRECALASPMVSFLMGFCLSAACTIKPDGLILIPPLLYLFTTRLRLNGQQWRLHLLSTFIGIALPFLGVLVFLIHDHALKAFIDVNLHFVPYHSSLWRLPTHTLLLGSVSSVMLPLFCLWLPVFVTGKRWRQFEDQALMLGFIFGIFSSFVQGRGYPYHRYPSEAFLLLLGALAFTEVLDSWARTTCDIHPTTIIARGFAIAGITFAAFGIVPRSLAAIVHLDWRHDEFRQTLTQDLNTLGGISLSGHVQCLEMADGCITTLYHARIVESSGFLYDCYLYPSSGTSGTYIEERDRYRLAFAHTLITNPPTLLIVSSNECGASSDFSYQKLTRWDWLRTFIQNRYVLVRDRVPAEPQRWGGKPALPFGYRIYRFKPPEGQ